MPVEGLRLSQEQGESCCSSFWIPSSKLELAVNIFITAVRNQLVFVSAGLDLWKTGRLLLEKRNSRLRWSIARRLLYVSALHIRQLHQWGHPAWRYSRQRMLRIFMNLEKCWEGEDSFIKLFLWSLYRRGYLIPGIRRWSSAFCGVRVWASFPLASSPPYACRYANWWPVYAWTGECHWVKPGWSLRPEIR